MDFRSTSCVFLGYSHSHHRYRCYDPLTERLDVVRHVRFNEYSFPFVKPTLSPEPSSFTEPYYSSYPKSPTPSPQILDTDHTLPLHSPIHTYSRRTHTHPSTSAFESYTQPHTDSLPIPTPSTNTNSSPEPTTPDPNTSTTPVSNSKHTSTSRTHPPNLRQHPKPNPKYTASSFHTQTSNSNIEPTSFDIANASPQWR
uniref:Retroviral polymerase SH3-like domain-containing protein n=1 Tax=Lactuca sativa TaxID=4236 RepID=A0A9R1W1D9_LACSA|nr:hypothetical protein LSAT_V11C400165940 [Lactuca sativa]